MAQPKASYRFARRAAQDNGMGAVSDDSTSGFYRESDANRRSEFQESLRRNVENDRFDEIHVFIEEAVEKSKLLRENPLLAGDKLRLIAHGRRVTYREFYT